MPHDAFWKLKQATLTNMAISFLFPSQLFLCGSSVRASKFEPVLLSRSQEDQEQDNQIHPQQDHKGLQTPRPNAHIHTEKLQQDHGRLTTTRSNAPRTSRQNPQVKTTTVGIKPFSRNAMQKVQVSPICVDVDASAADDEFSCADKLMRTHTKESGSE